MKNTTAAQRKEWLEAWKRAGAAMTELRRQDLRNRSESESVRIFNGFESPFPPEFRKSSGLIEQQRWFRRLHLQSGK